jgi:ubiquinone/menaquinone biosynthesis C-methylase UbiE
MKTMTDNLNENNNSRYWAAFWEQTTQTGNKKGPMTPGFWNHMAHRYARDTPQEKEEARLKKILDLIISTGIDIKGSQVLDIGAGTGSLSIPLAHMGAHVTALDFSEEMLKKLNKRADEENVTIQTVFKSWDTINLDEEGFRKKFDLVIASMTPAVRNPHDLSLMLETAKGICYYSGWVHRKWDPSYYDLYKTLFHEEFKESPHGFYLPFMYLYLLGYRPVVSLLEDDWSNYETIDEYIETTAGFFSTTRQIDDQMKDRIREYITPHTQDGKYLARSQVITGMMVWDVREQNTKP